MLNVEIEDNTTDESDGGIGDVVKVDLKQIKNNGK